MSDILDNTDIAHIALSDLEKDALELLERHKDDDDVVFFLARFVWQGKFVTCVPILETIAIDSNRGRYARITAIRAVVALGDDACMLRLWQAMAKEGNVDRQILAELIEGLPGDGRYLDYLMGALERAEPYERYDTTGLDRALHNLVDRMDVFTSGDGTQALIRFVKALTPFLEREPFIERGECHLSEEYAWLMPIALHAVDRLVIAGSPDALSPQALDILRNMPALRFWRQSEIEEYRAQLHQTVPRWPELNDVLYWRSIEERRAFVEAKSDERVTEDWRIAFMHPFWRFGPEDFDRVSNWVGSKPLLDDRLVALSRAFRLYRDNEKPEGWLERLRDECADLPELRDQLEHLVNPPPPSKAVREMEEEHAKSELERELEASEQNRYREEWINLLRENPSRITHPEGLEPGQLSRDQYYLMASINDHGDWVNRGYIAEWRSLEDEFGPDVARAYRDATMAHWRHYEPELLSEGAEGGGIPYALIFGLAGLAIEAEESEHFPEGLAPEEARRALRYVTWELNGYPSWFEALYAAFPEEGLDAVRQELLWELESRAKGGEPHHVLHDTLYHAPWLHEHVAPIIYDWLRENHLVRPDGLRYALAILAGGGVSAERMAELASIKVKDPKEVDHWPRWYALWVSTDPEPAIKTLESALESMSDEDAETFSQIFAVDLVGGRHASGQTYAAFRTPEILKCLYVLMHREIRVENDIERAGKGVYSPTLRDDAQDARNQLFSLLSEIPGRETYDAIAALAEDHPAEGHRKWMLLRARERAVKDADEPAWTDEQFCDVSGELSKR